MMAMREKLADWISGGALTRARDGESNWKHSYELACRSDAHHKQWANYYREVLALIAATPGENGTNGSLRKVIKLSKEALK